MRRTILMASAAVLALGFAAGSAYADVDVTVTVTKTKDITVNETITINKEAIIDVDVNISPFKAAEVDSLVNQANFDNTACENCAEKLDLILNSVNINDGIATVNQAAGNNNNQGSVLTAAVDDFVPGGGGGGGGGNTPGDDGFAEAQASVDQRNGLTEGVRNDFIEVDDPESEDPLDTILVPNTANDPQASPNTVDSFAILFRAGDIKGSINGNNGVVMVNQAPGQMNNQANNIAIAVALGEGGVALSESDLGQETSNNSNSESDVFKNATINTSVNNNTGVTLVNQAVGNMSNQANVLSLGAASLVGNL